MREFYLQPAAAGGGLEFVEAEPRPVLFTSDRMGMRSTALKDARERLRLPKRVFRREFNANGLDGRQAFFARLYSKLREDQQQMFYEVGRWLELR